MLYVQPMLLKMHNAATPDAPVELFVSFSLPAENARMLNNVADAAWWC